MAWLASVGAEAAITTISVGELLFGAQRLPRGRRRTALAQTIDRLVEEAGDRVLPFDGPAARAYGSLRTARESAGAPIAAEDLMIASICLCRGLPLATRDVRHFDSVGLPVINPWDAAAG